MKTNKAGDLRGMWGEGKGKGRHQPGIPRPGAKGLRRNVKDNPLNAMVSFRVTEAEKIEWDDAAHKNGQTLRDFIRAAVAAFKN
jgi:hypothetical protein